MTQQNAAQTEELRSTAQSLSVQAKALESQVAKFTLATERQAAPQAAEPSNVVRLRPRGTHPKTAPVKAVRATTGTDPAPGSLEEF